MSCASPRMLATSSRTSRPRWVTRIDFCSCSANRSFREGPPMQRLRTTCCIAGGGPAGVMAGYLLARAGVETLVLEKHKDFLRDFRGDTVHPSTLEVIAELGLLEEFLTLPHQEVRQLQGQIGESRVAVADFAHVPTRCKFIALMPQWHFLNFLAERAAWFPAFRLVTEAEVT